MRPVLFVAYYYPPAGGVAVQRSLKFAKYLPEFGWQPVVLTTTPGAYPARDESLWSDVPENTPIYRVKSYDINGLRGRASRWGAGKLLSALNLALMLPDAALFWSYLARGAVRRILDQHAPALVYSSSWPASAHLLARWVKVTYGLPWVADFRDPWSENQRMRILPGYRRLHRRLERQVLHDCDRIVTVSEPLAERFQRLAGPGAEDVLVIENGYDDSDIAILPPPRTDRFTITYTGSFSALHSPAAFVAAIDLLLTNQRIPQEQMRVLIAGPNLEAHIPSRPPFELLGPVPYHSLSALRQQSDLMLLVINEGPEHAGTYGSKLFEYLGSNRPVLALAGREGVAARLIEQARAGAVLPHDPAAIAEAVLGYYQRWQEGHFDHAPDWAVIQRYTRRNLAARLAAEFDRLAADRG